MSSSAFQYVGSELAVFAKARNWKARLRREMIPYLGGRVVEVGAGIGSMTVALAGAPVDSWLALEPDSALAEQIPIVPGRQVMVGVLADLPRNSLFDTILYIDVLEHLEDDAAELRRAASHLSPGGRLIVLVPAHNFLLTPFDEALGHYRRYDRPMLQTAAPFSLRLLRLRYLDSVGFFASLANKLILHQAVAMESQIQFWDRVMVPVSQFADPLLGFLFGKSVLGIWEKRA